MATDSTALKFRTRNYKHELRLSGEGSRSILNYTDELWETLMSQIAAHDFTGIVFYTGYHPFEFFLDYKEMPDVADQPAELRDAVRQRLSRGLEIAHKHGLTTFMQHYVGHFTEALMHKYSIKHLGRLSDIVHPEVERYTRYCYRATFEQLPDLDGLYFNYESAASGWRHVINTAIPEFNAMDRKPIMAHRLWAFTDVEGMRQMIQTYQGRVILGHKIADTNDTYYLPCADSRVMEWKKRLGKDIEWMFLIGPCHNCGTNLCDQLWGDYDFVQALLDDARKKGADSFSFHTVNEFFCADMPESVKVFSEHEKAMARFNRMHVQAVVDYVRGESKSPAQRAATMAQRVGVAEKAGAPLLAAVEASSQLVLLAYQQFCFSSAQEGYRNGGYRNHIQDPFMYNHASELSHQTRRPTWGKYRHEDSWVRKTIDTPVGPDNFLQYIIDYANPKQRKTTRNPKIIADLIKKNIAASEAALKQYRKLAGADAAARVEPYIRANALTGELVLREINAGMDLCKLYFATSKPAALKALKSGLKTLKGLQAFVDGVEKPVFKQMARVFMLNRGPDYKAEIAHAEKALAKLAKTKFPFAAYQAYMESRQLFNEIRRWIRPGRSYDRAALDQAAELLEKSLVAATRSAAILRKDNQLALADNVHAWMDYLSMELAFTKPPTAICGPRPTQKFYPFHRNHGFRVGEPFTEDFVGFFEPSDYRRETGLSFQLWHTDDALVVQVREEGVDMAARLALWDKCKDDSSSLSFITRVVIAPDTSKSDMFVIWPQGKGVSQNKVPDVAAKNEFSHTDTSWQATATIPFSLVGRRPQPGESWLLNVTANPFINGNADYTWTPQYDGNAIRLLGTVKFE